MRRGFYLSFSKGLDLAANARMLALTRRLLQRPLFGVTDLVPGYVNLYVEFEDTAVSQSRVRRWVSEHSLNLSSGDSGRLVEIPVRYDGEDLLWVTEQTGLSPEEVIRRHSSRLYRVYAIGFTPGFPFMGEVDPALHLPRRLVPRKYVPAHSVAIANAQTGIYPLASPGGWHLLGTALRAIYDPHRPEPFLLAPADAVRFVPAWGSTPPEPQALELLPAEPRYPAFRVVEPGLLDLVVDEGRRMAGRFGLAQSGPLDPRSARLANALVGNPADAPLLELTLKGPVLEALRDTVVAFAGFAMHPELNGEPVAGYQSFGLRRGDVLSFRPTTRGVRGYLAIAGGLESGRFWDSASTDLRGRIGRPLQAGDILGVKTLREVRTGFSYSPRLPAKPVCALRTPSWRLADEARVRLLPGPQANPEALKALSAGTYRLESGDRMGLKLEGPSVPGGELISEATPLGAIQVTPGGHPLILLNDRGRIGGYAKPAQVDPRDLPILAQLRPGSPVRFVIADEFHEQGIVK
ncbi:5-oxoprolinase subunit PxpB [Allomeiothermus silvanus]|uniref:5-oxoprolinase subunit PxpB n=1 Tax=Allomeiothermus silvanus TaxID=52022 RepID=UPI0023F3A3FA|nr:5-oxoprolinase subunit PxpB [Allomeiothermus silvanus]